MNISDARLEEFKHIYKKEFGKDLSDQEALDIAIPFLEMFRVIYRPLPSGKPVRFEPPNAVRDIIGPTQKKPSNWITP